MSNYCQAVGFMKIKPELLKLFKSAILSECDHHILELYDVIGLKNSDLLEYEDWFMNIDGGAQHYIDFDFECGFKDDYLIFSGSRSRAHSFIKSIKMSIPYFSESYIIITLDEDDCVEYITKNIGDVPIEYRHFYESFIIDRNKVEEPSGYGYAYAQYIKSL